ncbi:MAG: redoxin domain-containing protein [Gemmatimonadota bacterium]
MNAYRDQYATVFNGGKGVVLLAISVDPDTMLAAWASESHYPNLFLSDPDGRVGRMYGAWNSKYQMDDRSLFVIGPDGKIVDRQTPFREIDPTAYKALEAAVDRSVSARGGH